MRQELERVKTECESLQLQLRLESEQSARLRDADAKTREAAKLQSDADSAATRAQLEELRAAQATMARSHAESSARMLKVQADDAERIKALEALANAPATDMPLLKATMSKYDQGTRDRVKGYITTARESISLEIRTAIAEVAPAGPQRAAHRGAEAAHRRECAHRRRSFSSARSTVEYGAGPRREVRARRDGRERRVQEHEQPPGTGEVLLFADYKETDHLPLAGQLVQEHAGHSCRRRADAQRCKSHFSLPQSYARLSDPSPTRPIPLRLSAGSH